jgi:hypothetical protein
MSMQNNFTFNSYLIRRELVVTKNSLKKALSKLGMRMFYVYSEVGPLLKICPLNYMEGYK